MLTRTARLFFKSAHKPRGARRPTSYSGSATVLLISSMERSAVTL